MIFRYKSFKPRFDLLFLNPLGVLIAFGWDRERISAGKSLFSSQPLALVAFCNIMDLAEIRKENNNRFFIHASCGEVIWPLVCYSVQHSDSPL